MAKRIKKKPCETGSGMCLFQLGRSRCMAFSAKGTYYMDGSPTVLFRPIADISYAECMETPVKVRGTNSWKVIGETNGYFVPTTDHIVRTEVMLAEKVKKADERKRKREEKKGASGSEKDQIEKAIVKTKIKGITLEDDGSDRVWKNKRGEVVGIEHSLFE